jgi:hypothetical protein
MTHPIERSTDSKERIEFNPLIPINVVYIDYSMFYNTGSGFDEDCGITESADSAVPVVRIFGSTCSEKRACVHIHGVSLTHNYPCYYHQS